MDGIVVDGDQAVYHPQRGFIRVQAHERATITESPSIMYDVTVVGHQLYIGDHVFLDYEEVDWENRGDNALDVWNAALTDAKDLDRDEVRV